MSFEEILKQLEREIGPLKPEKPFLVNLSSEHVNLAWEDNMVVGFTNMQCDILYKAQMKSVNNDWSNIYCGNKPSTHINSLNPKSKYQFRYKIIVTHLEETPIPSKNILTEANPSDVNAASKITMDSLTKHQSPSIVATSIGSIHRNKSTSEIRRNKSAIILESVPEISKINYKSSNSLINLRSVSRNNRNSLLFNITAQEINDQVLSANELYNLNLKNDQLILPQRPRIETQWSEVLEVSTSLDEPSNVSLFLAIEGGFLGKAEMLFSIYPDMIESTNADSLTPLMVATMNGNNEMVQLLLQNGADVNTPSPKDHKTAIMVSAFHRKLSISKILHENGANLKASDINGLTALHYAVESNNLDTLKYFLANGGNVRCKDKNGWTPLFTAVLQSCDSDIVKFLVDHGSSIEAKDSQGLQPKQYAEMIRSSEDVRKILDLNYAMNRSIMHFRSLAKKVTLALPAKVSYVNDAQNAVE